jgi:hypothetical protein
MVPPGESVPLAQRSGRGLYQEGKACHQLDDDTFHLLFDLCQFR